MKRITRNNFDPEKIMKMLLKSPLSADEANRLLEESLHAYHFLKVKYDDMKKCGEAIVKISERFPVI